MCAKYQVLSNILNQTPPDTVDGMVFINFDCILNEILNQFNDIGYQSFTSKSKVVSDVVLFIIEIISHYRQFFRDDTMVLYHTDIESEPQMFQTGMNNGSEYRMNYVTRFASAKFRNFKELYTSSLYNVIQMVIDAVPNVHMIKTLNIDSSVVPLVFAKEYPQRKIVVVSWDNVDVLLPFYSDNIHVVYDARKDKGVNPIVVNGREYIDTVTNALNPNHYGKFAIHVVVAAVGSYHRSLYGLGKRPAGYDMIGQHFQSAFENTIVPWDFNDYSVISTFFKGQTKDDFEETYRGVDLEMQYQLLKDEDKTAILYKLDHNPVDPKEIIKLFPNMVFEWDKLFLVS
jgi:hypothetical protein